MRTLLFSTLILVLFAAPIRADSIDDAEAKRRGVAVEVIQLEKAQARIVELEKQVADLKSQLSEDRKPASAPATHAATSQSGGELKILLSGLPVALQPKTGESPRSIDDRADWIKEHLDNKSLTITMKIVDIGGSNDVIKYAEVMGKPDAMPPWAKEWGVCLEISPDPSNPRYYRGDVLTATGKFKQSSNGLIIFSGCKITNVKPAASK